MDPPSAIATDFYIGKKQSQLMAKSWEILTMLLAGPLAIYEYTLFLFKILFDFSVWVNAREICTNFVINAYSYMLPGTHQNT